MRKVLGVLLLVLGVPILVAGAYAALLIGPDDTAETGPHRLTSTGAAIVTTPEVLAYIGPTLHLTVTSANDKPVFVGIGPQLDVTSYLGTATHREITDLVLPWKITSAEVGADDTALAPPADQRWWIVQATGARTATLTWPLPNGRYQIVGLNADGSPGVDLNVVMGLEVDGAFYGALAVTLLGLLLVLLGLLLLLWKRLKERRAAARPDTTAVIPVANRDAVGPGVYAPAAVGSGFERVPMEPVVIEAAPREALAIEPTAVDPVDDPLVADPLVADPLVADAIVADAIVVEPEDFGSSAVDGADAGLDQTTAIDEAAIDEAASDEAAIDEAASDEAASQPAWPFTDGEPVAAEPADPTEDPSR